MADAWLQGSTDKRVHLLWTGGWDSTFRLLQLLLQYQVPVQPIYLEDPTRASTATELQTMAQIREHLNRHFPETQKLLGQIQRMPVQSVVVDPELSDALRDIRKRIYIGNQYAWLSAFCRGQNIAGLELGIHSDDKMNALIGPYAMEFEHPLGFRSLRIDPQHSATQEFLLFGNFSFPIFHVSKIEMEQQANRNGWGDLMEMTWFCHSPVNGRPCGICPPCVYTIEEGLSRRIPRSRRLLSVFYRNLLRPVKLAVRNARASRAG